MRIFVHEFVTGGGRYSLGDELDSFDSLATEGLAMLRAVIADLQRIEGLSIDTLVDGRLRDVDLGGATAHEIASEPQERDAIARLARAADWTIIIAPEFRGFLETHCRTVEAAGGRLLGPSPALVAIASDKHAAAERLAAHGVNVPRGVALSAGDNLPARFSYPAVLKPRDGAGSLGIERIDGPPTSLRVIIPRGEHRHFRLEEFCPGIAASVACLCGPREIVPLMPCRQSLSDDGKFIYQGGSLPIEQDLADRATRLAVRAVHALGPLGVGYLGVDMVLGNSESGRDDFVIEVNPRVTTSYVGLRALARTNLAAGMLAIACGGRHEFQWGTDLVEFDTLGNVSLGARVGSV